MSLVRVLCFVAVLHCMAAFVLQSDEERVNQEKDDIERIIELLRKEKLQTLARFHIADHHSTLRNVGTEEDPHKYNEESDVTEEEEEESEEESEESEDLQGRSLLDTNGHGAEIDGNVDPEDNPELYSLLNSFLDEENGEEKQGAGLDKSYKVQKDKMDSHKLTHEQKVQLGIESERPGEEKRNFLTTNILWPQGIVPYEITDDFTTDQKTIIETAIAEMAAKTCVKFTPKASTDPNALGHNSYISFFSESGCWSYVGRVFNDKQQISLQAPGCVTNSITIHEMCHAIGQMHEQSRSDRDNYVTMLWNNIQGGQGNFNMIKDNTRDNNKYDHESVLQYSLSAFSTNGNPTMEFVDRRLDFLANSANGLTFYDVKDITAAYQCNSNCAAKLCENGGFQDHTCACYCPEGLTGDRCQLVDTNNNCGGIIDVSGGPVNIISPNYPNNYDVNAQCTWLVKGAAGDFIKVNINDLHLSDNGNGRCYHWLEVQYNLLGQTGPRRCGDVVDENYITSVDGFTNIMLLRFDSKFSSDRPSNTGFNLTVSAVGPGCSLNPCVQGTCSSSPGGGFTCACDQGFSGNTCDIPSITASFTCTSDVDNCFLEQATDDVFDWTVQTGATPSSGTGPSSAQSGSYYLFAEMSSPRVQGDVARLKSKFNLPVTDRCLRFWYLMYGSSVGQLAVAASGTTTPKSNIWSLSGDQGDTWKQVSLDVPSTDGLEIFFEATRGSSWNSDIAIDTVEFTPGSCSSSTAATTTPAPTTTTPTTPAPTTTTPTTTPPPTTTTTPTTTPPPTTTTPSDPCVPNPCNNGGTCNAGVGTCVCPSGFTGTFCDQEETVPCPAGQNPCMNGGVCTVKGVVTSCACPGDFTGQFCETLLPRTYTCTFEDGAPTFLGQETLDTFDWTFPRSGSTPSSGTGPSGANEGTSYAFIESSSPRTKGDTAVLVSGILPTEDMCLTFDYHMYGSSMGDLRVLINDVSSPDSTTRSLWSKSGDQGDSWNNAAVEIPATPSLKVYFEAIRGSGFRSDVAIDNVVLTPGICGCAASPCQNGGICSEDPQGQTTCTCPPGFTGALCDTLDGSLVQCSFEDNSVCFLNQDQTDDFDWTIRSGGTPSSYTGPSSAYEGNNYAYIETSSPRQEYDAAEFYVDFGASADQRCLSFAYHMYGDGMGTLEITFLDGQQTSTLWSLSGDQGDQWETAAVQIPASNNGQMYITGIRGNNYKSDIAIDNVLVKAGLCGCLAMPCQNGGTCTDDANIAVGYFCSCDGGYTGELCENTDGSIPLTCTFEDGNNCFLDQVTGGMDVFDWTTRQGSTPSTDTGPDSAHTGSKYAYIEASSPRLPGDNAILTSEQTVFPSMDQCLSFYYHMKGTLNGDLIVLAGERASESQIWSVTGPQGDGWLYAEVDVPSAADLVIAIEGVRGNDWKGDIAIDDVELSAGLC